MPIDNTLVSGSMSMLILKLLSEKDMYGYEMIDTLRKRSENVFELKAGTLYPLLHGMEEKGMLEVYEQDCGDSPCHTDSSEHAAYAHILEIKLEETVVYNTKENEYQSPFQDLEISAFAGQSVCLLLCI
mgnify:CR=1 FL=1